MCCWYRAVGAFSSRFVGDCLQLLYVLRHLNASVEANEIIESLNQLQERIGWLSQVVELQGQLSSLEASAAELPGFSFEQLKDCHLVVVQV